MVTRAPERRRGGSTLGCLFSLLIVAVVLYYGLDLGRIYWSYYRLTDEMETSARFAQGQTDAQVVKHLAGVAQDLGLPPEAQRFVIRRTQQPFRIEISTRYEVEFDLPFQHRVLTLRPQVDFRQ
jgi:hypothetical protein